MLLIGPTLRAVPTIKIAAAVAARYPPRTRAQLAVASTLEVSRARPRRERPPERRRPLFHTDSHTHKREQQCRCVFHPWSRGRGRMLAKEPALRLPLSRPRARARAPQKHASQAPVLAQASAPTPADASATTDPGSPRVAARRGRRKRRRRPPPRARHAQSIARQPPTPQNTNPKPPDLHPLRQGRPRERRPHHLRPPQHALVPRRQRVGGQRAA